MRANVTAEGEDGGEVNLQDLGPVRVGELVRGVAALNAAAVKQDVNGVAVCENCRDEGGDGGLGGEVGDVDGGFAAEGFDGGFGGGGGGGSLLGG